MIQEGWIWTYYDCSYVCYLFGRFELPCMLMTLSIALFALGLIAIILFAMKKLATSLKPNNNVIRIKKSLFGLKKATEKRRVATYRRRWVEMTPHIHALNYWYYKWFTNDFLMFVMDHPENEE